ncbi:unnamed protein product [Discosporangium mesarthrocarpum]
MVLCVSQIYTSEQTQRTGAGAGAVIEVTDGWYAMDAFLDDALTHFVHKRRIQPGFKLAVACAVLRRGRYGSGSGSGSGLGIGSGIGTGATRATGGGYDGGEWGGLQGGGVDPLELLGSRAKGEMGTGPGMGPYLSLGVNSVRLARWDARLGFVKGVQRQHGGMGAGGMVRGLRGAEEREPSLGIPLCTVVPGGGTVSAVKVRVMRRNPVLYVEHVDYVEHGGGSSSIIGATVKRGNTRGSSGGEDGGLEVGREGGRAVSLGSLASVRTLCEAEEEGVRAKHEEELQHLAEAAMAKVNKEVGTLAPSYCHGNKRICEGECTCCNSD